ncbi:hypothetical protein BDP27DRAFT_1370970 [Rhodocollybia butyracea]|uniref:Uncharacterized protein n=1 Tax=Rhodocollybia butyracea TaxID=206335 RepID=A0A9P5TXZ4_9AGAR|nr:hypothetical protein BDP27DRAFT_1370970 [Rhodocollybia butyracea]
MDLRTRLVPPRFDTIVNTDWAKPEPETTFSVRKEIDELRKNHASLLSWIYDLNATEYLDDIEDRYRSRKEVYDEDPREWMKREIFKKLQRAQAHEEAQRKLEAERLEQERYNEQRRQEKARRLAQLEKDRFLNTGTLQEKQLVNDRWRKEEVKPLMKVFERDSRTGFELVCKALYSNAKDDR